MNKIPFSVYDFFGYLSSGFILLAAVDFAFMRGTLLRQKLDGFSPVVFFWLVLVYVLGHLVANVASFLLETKAVRCRLGAPEDLLVALTSAFIVLVPVIQAWCQHRPSPQDNLWWAVAGVLVSVGMFYRFLKFFRLYTTEVFITYAEIDRPTEGKPI